MKFLFLFTLQWSNYRFIRLYNRWLAESVRIKWLALYCARQELPQSMNAWMLVMWRVRLERLNKWTAFIPKLPSNNVTWQRLLLHNLQICTNIPLVPSGSTSALMHTVSPRIIGLLRGYLTRGQDQIRNPAFLHQHHLTLLWECTFIYSLKWVTSFGATDISKWKSNGIQWWLSVDSHFKTRAANVCL